MNRLSILITGLFFFQLAGAALAGYGPISDKQAMPCERTIELTKITKAVIPMTPFRGVNIIFPYKLPESTTTYVLSGTKIWSVEKSKGGNLVSVTFSEFSKELFGTVRDLTISTPNHLVSLALKADPSNHCTNIVLKLPPDEQQRLEAEEQTNHLAALDAEYQKRFDALDRRATEMALSYVGSLTNKDPDTTRIFEASEIPNTDGDPIRLYVDKVERYGKFNIIRFELKNESNATPIHIDGISAGVVSESGQRLPINGYADYKRQLGANESANYLFTTLEPVPGSNGFLTLETDQGRLEVTW